MSDPGKLHGVITDEDFDALRCIINYARSLNQCLLGKARDHAIANGFSQASIDAAVKFWAQYEGNKSWMHFS